MLPGWIDGDVLSQMAERAAPAQTELAFVSRGRIDLWPDDAGTALFDLGSVTKTFTALLLAVLIERDEVALDDTVGDHLPEARGAADVRLVELATHTSGLPLVPEPILSLGDRCPDDPYSVVTDDAVLEAARHARPGPTRGSFEYSNFGYGLLGAVLAAAGGAPFGDLLSRRVLVPLGLRDTLSDVHDDPRRIGGHDIDGTPVPPWHNPAMPGCGGLLATAGDIGRYVAAHLHPDATPLGAAIRRTHELRLHRPSGQAMALAWLVDDIGGDYRYWHNGATFGSSSYAAFTPGAATGIAVLRNRTAGVTAEVELLGDDLLGRLGAATPTT